MEQQANKVPSVIPRSDIPVALGSSGDSLEVQPFTAHRLLSSLLPSSPVSLAWTKAHAGRDVELRSQPTPGLLIILEGRAVLIGALSRNVEGGDVITLPANQKYGFTAIGPAGLQALLVSLAGDSLSYADDAQTLSQLVGRNDARLQTTLNNDFFLALRGRAVEASRKTKVLTEALCVLSDAFETLRVTRRMVREGANSLEDAPLDDAELIVAQLVFTTCKHYLARLSWPLVEDRQAATQYGPRADKEPNLALLAGFDPPTYVRLQRVLDRSWDTVDALTQPLVRLLSVHECS
jgi:hypothetical protein